MYENCIASGVTLHYIINAYYLLFFREETCYQVEKKDEKRDMNTDTYNHLPFIFPY